MARARRRSIGAAEPRSSRARPTNINRIALGMCTALVALSLVPLTGWAGQVSLAPLAFAGIGAVAYAAARRRARQHLGGVPRRAGHGPDRRAASRSRPCACRVSISRSRPSRSRRWSKRCSTRNRSRSVPASVTVDAGAHPGHRLLVAEVVPASWSRSCSGYAGSVSSRSGAARSGDDSSRCATARPRR